MSTYLTSLLEQNKTFEEIVMEYAKSCFIQMRGLDDFPEQFEADISYEQSTLLEKQEELKFFINASDKEIQKRQDTEINNKITEIQENIEEVKILISKYKEFTASLNSWKANRKISKIKSYVKKSLKESIELDGDLDYYNEELNNIKKLSVEEYRNKNIQSIEKYIKLMKDGIKKEIAYNKKSNNVLNALRESLRKQNND